MSDNCEILGSDEVARRLGLHRRAVTRAAQRGELPGICIGRYWRFRWDAVLRAMESRRVAVPA